MLNHRLKALEAAFDTAKVAFIAELKRNFPQGAEVGVMLSSAQRVPSRGVVVRVCDGRRTGLVSIKLDKPKRRGGHTYRDVPYSKVEVYSVPEVQS